MPIYDYLCPDCGNRFDKLVKLNPDRDDSATMPCPVCGAAARKVVSPFRIAGSSSGASSFEDEAPASSTPNVTSKADIERWRKESKKK